MGKATTAQNIRKAIDTAQRAHERLMKSLRYGLDLAEAPAREAYARSTAGLHNLHTKSWHELSQGERDKWLESVEG